MNMPASANVFLVTHKCGNNYIESVFKNDETLLTCQSDDLKGEMPGPYVGEVSGIEKDFVNIRCRNFDPLSIERLLRHIDINSSRFYMLTRHPASFFRSAASYHLRFASSPRERWAKTNKYSCLGGKTLSEAIVSAGTEEERLRVSMKFFGLAWNLLDRWVLNYRFLVSLGVDFRVVKAEDLFQDGSESFFSSLAEFMSHGSYQIAKERLKEASPLYMEKLPRHSTGEFRKDPFSGYGQNALGMYYDHFYDHQNFFYSGNGMHLL